MILISEVGEGKVTKDSCQEQGGGALGLASARGGGGSLEEVSVVGGERRS